MSAVDCPVESRVREVLHDISFFEHYSFPASPPFTPPMKNEARMADSKVVHTPTNPTLDRMFPRSPPESPLTGIKRKFSTNLQSTLSGILTPPSTPPTNSMRTMTSTIVNGNEISYFSISRRPTLVSRPTVVTADFDGSPSRRYPSRTSSRSSSYSSTVLTPRSSKDALARCKDYAALSTDSQYPLSPSPLYHSTGSTPPPNTPMYPLSDTMLKNGLFKQSGAPLEPFPSFHAGPSNLSTVSTHPSGFDYVPQYPNLPGSEDFKLPELVIEDLEKERTGGESNRDSKDLDPPLPNRPRKRNCTAAAPAYPACT